MTALKEQLYRLCLGYLAGREAEIKKTIADIREAAANETKSSAGDKYETAREVMQQEIDLNMARLSELNKMKATLEHISPAQEGATVQPGSVVCTSNGNFYISVSAGRLSVDDTIFYAISAASPIGAQLAGKVAGQSFGLNGKLYTIEKVI